MHRFLILLFSGLLLGCADAPVPEHDLEIRPSEWIKTIDEKTSRAVWQITQGDTSVACYFEAQCFTADERYVVYNARRDGAWSFFRTDLETGEMVRLSTAGHINMHPDGHHAYLVADSLIRRVDIYTAAEEVILDARGTVPGPFQFTPAFSQDGRYLVTTNRDDANNQSLIIRVDLETGEPEVVLRWDGWFTHPLPNPAHPDQITFVPGPDTQNDMSLPMAERARTWMLDVSTGEARPYLTMPYGFRATHEIWAPNGERFFFYRKTQPGWVPVSIMSMKADGTDWQEHYSHDAYRLGHGAVSNDGRWFVSDGQTPNRNPLLLISLETGAAETLAWPNASIEGGHRKRAHVHPSFSPSGRYIVYTSDRSGVPQVYVVPVAEEVRARLSQAEAL